MTPAQPRTSPGPSRTFPSTGAIALEQVLRRVRHRLPCLHPRSAEQGGDRDGEQAHGGGEGEGDRQDRADEEHN